MGIPRVLSRIPTSRKIVALTFDIANGQKVPLKMLSVLRKHGVRQATFFITGLWAASHPGIAARIRRSGYEIASHGHRHRDYRHHSNAWIGKEVATAKLAIRRNAGVRTQLFRPPGGDMNGRVIRKLLSMKVTIVHWDVDSLDWKLRDVRRIAARVVPRVRPGSIVLLHACDPWTQSLQAVPVIVSRLRQKGYRFAGVTELVANR